MHPITLVVPIYKVQYYINRCIASILGQEFGDFELILVDDGSPDGCGSICDECAVKDSRAYVVHQQNGGLSAARNAGIDWAMKCSDSQWLAFVDSDDWIHPKYLEYLHNAVRKHNTRVAVCEYAEVEEYEPPVALCGRSETMSWDALFTNNNVTAVVAWNKLYAKELFDGLRYPFGRIHEDEFLTYKLLHRAGDVAFVSSPLYFYFHNCDGITGQRFSLARLDAADAFLERIEFARIHVPDKLMRFCLRSYLNYCHIAEKLLDESPWIPSEIRKREAARLKRQARWVFVRFGLRWLSPRYDYDCYSYIAPHLMRAVRSVAGAIKRCKAVV